MNVKNKIKLLALMSVFALCTFGCTRNMKVDFAASSYIDSSMGVEWAVIREPYAAYRENPNYESSVVGHGRKGDILSVKGKIICDGGKDLWFLFEQGYLNSSEVVVYDNRYKAQNESSKLISK